MMDKINIKSDELVVYKVFSSETDTLLEEWKKEQKLDELEWELE